MGMGRNIGTVFKHYRSRNYSKTLRTSECETRILKYCIQIFCVSENERERYYEIINKYNCTTVITESHSMCPFMVTLYIHIDMVTLYIICKTNVHSPMKYIITLEAITRLFGTGMFSKFEAVRTAYSN